MKAKHIHFDVSTGQASLIPIPRVADRPQPTEPENPTNRTGAIELKNTRRVPSANEASCINTKWVPKAWYTVNCAHDRSYFRICAACRRDQKEADARFAEFLASHAK